MSTLPKLPTLIEVRVQELGIGGLFKAVGRRRVGRLSDERGRGKWKYAWTQRAARGSGGLYQRERVSAANANDKVRFTYLATYRPAT